MSRERDPDAGVKNERKARDDLAGELLRVRDELRAEVKAHAAHHEHDNAEIVRLTAEVEQMHTQMAGISVAAMGGTSEPQRATRGMYGWSVPYQDVLELRLKYDALRADMEGEQ